MKELFDFVTDVTITSENIDEYLERCMAITANRTVEDITAKEKVDEEVNVFDCDKNDNIVRNLKNNHKIPNTCP